MSTPLYHSTPRNGHMAEMCRPPFDADMARNSRIDDREDEGIPATAECLRVIGVVVGLGSLALAAFIKLVMVL